MAYPKNFRYTKEHEWVNVERRHRPPSASPITRSMNWATSSSSSCPSRGARSKPARSFGTVESVKAVSEIYAPAAGEVIEANGDCTTRPRRSIPIRTAPAWLIKVKLANAAEVSALMDAAAYEAYIAEKDKEASA